MTLLLGIVLGAALYHVALASLAQRTRVPVRAELASEDVATALRRGRR